jgi:succinyl-diaminopimelate desuccinylase
MKPDEKRMLQLLESLVAFDTQNPPGFELEAAQFLETELREMGLDTSLSEFKPGRANVVARLANGPGPVFAFNSHIDVVPAGDGWASEPLRLTERAGKLYGRGSCDAKGPIVGMLEAIRDLAAQRDAWSGTLLAVFVADEEVASEGARNYVGQNPDIDYCLIGEPTSNSAVTAHKGSMRPRVAVLGAMAHSGMPDSGENAILRAGRLLGLIEDFHHNELCKRTHALVGSASLTVTRLAGGIADNVVPDRCELLLDRRMVPGEDEEQAKREIENLLETAEREYGVRAEIVEYVPTTGGATETDISERIVQESLAASARHEGGEAKPNGFQGGCDLVHFRSIGATGTVIGPGSIDVAHKPDEFVPRDEFIRSALIYRDIAERMLHS